MGQPSYANLNACTLVPEANSTYLAHTGTIPTIAPANSPTMGLMMFLSALQYQAPYLSPQYSNAASQAGKAAFIQSGGQKMADQAKSYGTDQGHELGINDTEAAIVFFAAKTARDRQIKLNGPKIYDIKTNLTVTPDSGSVGIKYEW